MLLAPVTTGAAFPRDEDRPREARTLTINGRQAIITTSSSGRALPTLAGLPASVAPIGETADGLPVGVQIVGPYLEDRTPIAFAAALEELYGFRRPARFRVRR